MDNSDNQATCARAANAEDDEESTYIYIDLNDVSAELMPSVGSTISLQGLGTEAPQMVTSTGLRLAGAYEDSLGSLLFFLLQQQRPAGAASDQSPQPGKDAAASADSAFAAGPSSLPQPGGAASMEERSGKTPNAESSDMPSQPNPSSVSDQEQQAGSTIRPTSRSTQKDKYPKACDIPASAASFLAHTDTVLRFRKAP